MTVTALLGPTNTGKTHRAIERMLEHDTGMIGLPLRLLAREVYDRITAQIGEQKVALVTGEEKRIPRRPSYWVCTVESMPSDIEVDFLCVDEIQLAAHPQRGHTFTDRLLHGRGLRETWFLGSDTMRPMFEQLVPTATVVRHPRLSQLSYTGAHSLAALPSRTAVVAFSTDAVYEIAQRLRRQHGGTAVVLGALSPRTRNAQVAMYQAGEVDHIVATDAIGMGLNLDVDRVVFASLDKFDGRQTRPLDVAELAQIAGRAGRYTTDGGFGTLRPLDGLPPRVTEAVEGHRFPDNRRLVWRNRDLDFSTVPALLASLRQRPTRRVLHLVERADDFEALGQLARHDAVQRRATSPERIALLWDVCRIPDFRKLLLDSHVQLLAAVYEQLTTEAGQIETDWMAARIARLQTTDGDIPTLMSRIAFIRTWTYITHHVEWLCDAEHWQQVTRQIEDRQSDALHERLTERFVDAPGGAQVRPATRRRRVKARREALDPGVVADSPFAALIALEDELPDRADDDALTLSPERAVETIVTAEHAAFRIDDALRISHRGEELGFLRAGSDAHHPEVVVRTHGPLGAGAQQRILRRLRAWVRDEVALSLEAPLGLHGEFGPHARGLVYQLRQGFGTLDRAQAAAQLRRLPHDERLRLQAAGIVFGRRTLYVPAMATAGAVRLRAALWRAFHAGGTVPPLPATGAVSVPRGPTDAPFFTAIGFVVVGPRAIRQDQLERALDRLAALGPGPWALPPEIGAWLGCGCAVLRDVLVALGFRPVTEGWLAPRHRRRRRGRTQARDGSR
jgi:ATP-dependent RNA helicase SUPV3L1/SUV3